MFTPPDQFRDFFAQSPYPLLGYPSGENLWDLEHAYTTKLKGSKEKAT